MTRLIRLAVPFIAVSILGIAVGQPVSSTHDVPPVPKTAAKPVTRTYQGISVTDPYKWLEQGADSAVRQWTEQQNRHARALLDRYPGLPALRAQIKRIVTAISTAYNGLQYKGGKLFALKL